MPVSYEEKPVSHEPRPPRTLYANTIMVSYLGTQVGHIYLEDLGAAAGKILLISWGEKLFFDHTEPYVQKSLEKGTLAYFSNIESSEAFKPYGAPLVIYDITLRSIPPATPETQ